MKYNALPLIKKADRVGREIIKAAKNPEIKKLAERLGTPEKAYEYLKKNVRYKKESTDKLYDPMRTLKRGEADCEDHTLLMGALAFIQGYPVWVRIIKGATNHILPYVYVNGEWKAFDLAPQVSETGGYAYSNYETYTEGLVTMKGLQRPENRSKNKSLMGPGDDSNGFIQTMIAQIPIGLGIGLGTALSSWVFQKYIKKNL